MSPVESLVESRRQIAQADLDSKKSAAERNRLGQFATPNTLAVEIARYVESIAGRRLDQVHFADPAIGTGSFYSAALTAFGSTRIARAIGIELDPAFCETANDLWRESGLEMVQGDFTRLVATRDRPFSPNLILTNPPYVRHHHLTREEKCRLQALTHQLTGIPVNGLAGLYVYYLLLATEWMKDGGYAAWLIPSEFMDVNYGEALRRYLASRVTLIRLHRFDPNEVQFSDALVSSVALVFQKTPPEEAHRVEFTFGGTIESPRTRDLIPIDRLRHSRKWTTLSTSTVSGPRTLAPQGEATLSDFFRIKRGIATGSNEFFILDREDAARRSFPAQYLKPILPAPRFLTMTVIDADDSGYPMIDRQLCLIDCPLPEPDLRLRHRALWEYLQTAESLGVIDRYLVRKRNPWYKQEQRPPAPYLCTYMGRGANGGPPFRFIWNRSQAIATNLYLMLYPKARLASMLQDHPDRAGDVFALLGQVTGQELCGEGRVYGGGLNKIEPAELGRVSAGAFVARWAELRPERQREMF